MTARARTRSVGVLGGGIAGIAAAAAFRRALPEARVTLFASAGEAAGPEYPGAAAPSIHRFHRQIGLDPELFARRTGALAVREAEIRRGGMRPFRLAPLTRVPYVDGVALHQLWLRWTATEPVGPAWAEVARRASSKADVAEGLGVRFDARAYMALLGELAVHVGVRTAIEAPEAADLASSFDLVIDTQASAGAPRVQVHGVPGGLKWTFAPALEERDAGLETLDLDLREASWSHAGWRGSGRAEGDAGRVEAPWNGNVLAIGRAAMQCETLDGQPLSVALASITRAIELLPRPGASGREAAEYNRRTNAVHDFLLDWAAERWGAAGDVPAGRAALRGQFTHRGRIPFRDEDPVPPGQWLGWLLGSGERPRNLDLAAAAVPPERLEATFAGV